MMKLLKKLLLVLVLVLPAAAAQAAVAWDKAPKKTTDLVSLQNGAKVFVNYCLSCHAASFMRYNRLQDLGMTEQEIKDNLLFTTDSVGDTMHVAITPAQGKAWFGTNPPDLTVIARSRSGSHGSGADYIYTLFRTYYRDDTRPTGWNNLVFPNIGMPNPLWELQGERTPVHETVGEGKHASEVFTGRWQQTKPGLQSPEQYDETVADLVNYLQWMSEPVQNKRVQIGVWVMLFLLLFTLMAWRLNAAYWKDVR